jgi:hypothetical protein
LDALLLAAYHLAHHWAVAIWTPTQANIKVSVGLSHGEEALFFWLGTIPNHVHTNILQKKKTMWFFKGLLSCLLSGDHGWVGLSNAADIMSFKWTFAKLTHTVIDESIVYRIWTLRFSHLKKSIQGHVCNVHGYLYALLSCDILNMLGDLKFAPPSEDSKSCHVVLMIFIINSNFDRNTNSYSPH